MQSLTPDHRRLIAQASLEEPVNSPASFGVEVDATDRGTPHRLEALHIKPFGRFGNLLVQIGHALDVARFLGIDTIYYDVAAQAPGVFEVSRPVEIDGMKLIAIDHRSPPREKTLSGTFWSLHFLIPEDVGEPFTRDVVASQKLFDLLSDDVRNNLVTLQPSDIIAHFRGGDVFKNNFNLDYTQPPFAFYRKAIEDAAEAYGGTVHIVCEDKLNPAVDATISWLESGGKRFELYSGELRDDLKVMFAARAIVASYGTFVSAVMKLSPNVRSVFCFDNAWVTRDQERFRPDVDVRRYIDARGAYTKHGEWRATDEQVSLILTYDIESIVEMN